ncbi:MAG: hypothetical protein DI538_25395 [Azospira oryzae]|jgi:uncharacterized membrane protein YjfL (UPF0719 family)|nr:MAG: hypothetical protein DI538_25395 [Azospira oryzae]
MNTKLTMLALIEIISALSMGIFILAATYQLLKYVGRKRYGIHQNNQAYSIFMASVLFAIGYTVSSAIQPLISLFRILAMKETSDLSLAIRFILTGGSYIGMAFVIGAVVCLLGIVVYTYLTPVDEFEELRNNNLAVAVIVGSIVITLSLLTKDGVSLLLESFIPYPEQYPK